MIIPIPFATQWVATARGTAWKVVTCSHCRQRYAFVLELETTGEEVGLMLPRGEVLRGGDLVTASDGRVIEVIAEPEKVLAALVHAGVPVRQFTVDAAGLEDVFVALTGEGFDVSG